MEDVRFPQAIEATTNAMPRRAALSRMGIGGMAAGWLLGTGSGDASAQSSLDSAATEAAARRAVNAINQALASGDMSLLDLAFAPDYVNHTSRRSLQTGQLFSPDLTGLAAGLTELRAAVPDAVLVVDDVVAAGNTAAIRATFRGTVDPTKLALPEGASPRLSIGGAAFLRIANGHVIESWEYDEAAELLALAGKPAPTPALTPTPAPVATTTPATPGEVREVSDFQEVELDGVGTLLIQQGDTESLTIDADAKVLRRIATEVRRGRLTISPARSFNTREPITYYLTVKQLTSLEISGAGAAEADALTADQLHLGLNGAGSLTIDQLTANTLDVSAQQNGAVQLAGAVDQQTVVLGGSAKYIAGELASRVAMITVDGAAQATVNVSESLQAQAGGAARIEYIGNPQVQQDVSAAGSVVNVG